uniref:Uncharacterized protein n=1 Tax=Chaetoceros debilis TaxID=122233 RepID=A0A7S3Q568_9STRA
MMTFACGEIKEKDYNFSYGNNIGWRPSMSVDIYFVLLGNSSICSTFDETQPQCHHALKAVCFLTDVITKGSKVGIVDRSQMLRKIIRLYRKQKIHPWISERILSSCLAMCLTLFRTKNEASSKSYFRSSIQFLPGRSIIDEGSVREDIPLLIELVTTVFRGYDLNHTGHNFLLGVCCGEDMLMDLENNFNPQNLSLVCFKAMISFLYKDKYSLADDKDLKSANLVSCSGLLDLLKEYEKKKWTRANIRKPKWLKKPYEEFAEQRLGTRVMDQSIKTSISVALVQVLPIPAMVPIERMNTNKLMIYYRSVISLLGNSWVSNSSHRELEKDYSCRCTVETRHLSAVTFFNVTATCFPKNVNGVLAESYETSNYCDLLFSSTEHSCTIVQECLLRDRLNDSQKCSVLHALGEFYLAICSDKGSERILRSASHSQDREAILRYIRQVMLCTINCFIRSNIHDAAYSENANFYIKIFHQLCTDLNSGLRGMNGGITESLCCRYIDAILSIFEKISEGNQGKLTLLDSENVDYQQLEIKCNQISKASLQSIIACSVSDSLKRLVTFILLDIPQFRREIILKMIDNIDFTKNALKCKAVEYDSLLKTAIDWSISSIKECNALSKKPLDAKINTEKVVSGEYVLATCFSGVERPWVELSRLTTISGQKVIPLHLAKAYACHYMSELEGSLIAMFSVFDSVVFEPPLILQLLSQSTKCRISKCVEQILSTVKNSISCLFKYYEGLRRGDVAKDTKYCDHNVVKALTCFLAWIQFTLNTNHSTARDNIVAGIKQWKEKEDVAQIPKSQVSKSFSRVMKRLEEVHKSVLKFQQLLNRNLTNPNRNAETQFATLVDDISPPNQDIQEEENSLDFKQKIDAYVTKLELSPPSDDVFVSENKKTKSLKSSQEGSPRKGTSPRPRSPMKRGRSSDKSPKRSQNDVVDEWLRLDQHQGNNDNFEDLEDFLIPG